MVCSHQSDEENMQLVFVNFARSCQTSHPKRKLVRLNKENFALDLFILLTFKTVLHLNSLKVIWWGKKISLKRQKKSKTAEVINQNIKL
jgi:hypothetical protein